MYSPYSKTPDDVTTFFNKNVGHVYFLNPDKKIKDLEAALLEISSDIHFFESVVTAIFERAIIINNTQSIKLCERMGFWDFPQVKNNPNWSQFLFEHVIFWKNLVHEEGRSALIKACSMSPKPVVKSLIHQLNNINFNGYIDNDVIKNAIELYSAVCKEHGINDNEATNTAFESIVSRTVLQDDSEKNVSEILDCLDRHFDGCLSESNLYIWSDLTYHTNDLRERSLREVVLNFDASNRNIITNSCISSCIELYPGYVLRRLKDLSAEEILENHGLNIIKEINKSSGRFSGEDLDIYRSVISSLAQHKNFGHYLSNGLDTIHLSHSHSLYVFIDEIYKAGMTLYIKDHDAHYESECKSIIDFLSRNKDINAKPFADLFVQTTVVRDICRAYKKLAAHDGGNNTYRIEEHEEYKDRAIKASCLLTNELLVIAESKNADYAKCPILSVMSKSRGRNDKDYFESLLPMMTLISLSIPEEERVKIVDNSEVFIKHMVINGHMSKNNIPSLSPKSKRDVLTSALGL